jgi:hypothetical protein
VRYLTADAGITQFLDIGTGLPTQGNVHQVARDINPAAPGGVRRRRPDGAGPLPRAEDRREHRFFAGLELIDPGPVQVPYWRPGPEPADAGKVRIPGRAGCKPGPFPSRAHVTRAARRRTLLQRGRTAQNTR